MIRANHDEPSMTLFWILCALLILLAAAFVAVPLWRGARRADAGPARTALNAEVYRDQLQELDRELAEGVLAPDQHAIARNELDRRALAETMADTTSHGAAHAATRRGNGRWLGATALTLIPVATLATYLAIGSPEALRPPEQQFAEMVEGLAQRLQSQPDDVQGWMMLGRAYQVTGRMREAVSAFEKASALSPDNPDLMASHADALAMVQGSLAGRPFELVVRALKIDPRHPTALALAATAAMENRQFDEAIVLWLRLRERVEPGSRDQAAIDEAIAQVRAIAASSGVTLAPSHEAAGDAPAAAAPVAPAGAVAGAAATGTASISGEVSLAPELARQVRPDESLFIFARAVDGPPLPLAVLRAQVKDLPLRFTLDDSLAMAPGARLSMHKTVVVSARISRSGEAMPQAGDLTGSLAEVPVGASGLALRITEVVR